MTARQTFRNTLVVLLTLLMAYAILMSLRILIVALIAIILASAMRPFVLWLQQRRLPQGLAILIVYGGLAILVFTLAVLVFPPAVQRLSLYLNDDGRLAGRIIGAQTWLEINLERLTGSDVEFLEPEVIVEQVSAIVASLTEQMPNMIAEIGAVLGEVVLVFVVGVYWLTARDQAVEFSTSLFSLGRRGLVASIIEEIELGLGNYVRGLMVVVLFVGVANFIILSLFRVPNAITLAFIMGITTTIPVVGGFIGAGGAALLAILSSPVHALITLASFVAVQQVEAHYLTPRVMARSVGLNPILIIVILFIGFSLGGIVGGIIALPVAGMLYILLKHLLIEPHRVGIQPTVVEGGVLISTGAPAEVRVDVEPTIKTP